MYGYVSVVRKYSFALVKVRTACPLRDARVITKPTLLFFAFADIRKSCCMGVTFCTASILDSLRLAGVSGAL